MKDISIIIPAYNAEAYLENCLNSLVNQTKKNIEIIVVNDGSKDNTEKIAKSFENKYPEIIKVISKQNEGQSIARNVGISEASGKYIAFVDSDDFVSQNMFEILFNKAIEKDYDIVACNVNCIYPHKETKISSGISVTSENLTKEDKNNLLLNMYAVVWNKIYKKSLFENKDLLFEPNLWFEDVLFLYKLIPYINSIAYVEDSLYQYIQRPNSITYTYSDRLLDINKMLNKLLDFYRNNELNEYENELEYIYTRYMLATYIKRLSKSKDITRFKSGIDFAKKCVNEKFPKYKENIYLQNKCFKNWYLKHFSYTLAIIIYYLEKNKMN